MPTVSKTEQTSSAAAWTDLVVADATLANVAVLVQNLDDNEVRVVAGGAGQPAATVPGVVLGRLDSVQVTSDHIWVKGGGQLGLTTV